MFKLIVLLALVGAISGQGSIIDQSCQDIRNTYLSNKGNLIQKFDSHFFNIYNRIRSYGEAVINNYKRNATYWNATCANFTQMKGIRGATSVKNFCKDIGTLIKQMKWKLSNWMTTFYYNKLGMTTDTLDAIIDAWPAIEDHQNSILDLNQQNPDCVKAHSRNYSAVYVPYFNVADSVCRGIYANMSSYFKKSVDASYQIPGTIVGLANELKYCTNASHPDVNGCIAKFVSTLG
jgi:hypothetical protein